MDLVLQKLPGVVCYIDDILVTGVDDQDHLKNFNLVLERLATHGVGLCLTHSLTLSLTLTH